MKKVFSPRICETHLNHTALIHFTRYFFNQKIFYFVTIINAIYFPSTLNCTLPTCIIIDKTYICTVVFLSSICLQYRLFLWITFLGIVYSRYCKPVHQKANWQNDSWLNFFVLLISYIISITEYFPKICNDNWFSGTWVFRPRFIHIIIKFWLCKQF